MSNTLKKEYQHPSEKEGYIMSSHYTQGKYELIDIMEDQLSITRFIGWCKGIVLKYVIRVSESNETNERALTKASYYLDELIKYLKSRGYEENEDHIKPPYYHKNNLETIEVIEDKLPQEELEGFYQGMIIRYVVRSSYKGYLLDDLIKAQYYLNRYIKILRDL